MKRAAPDYRELIRVPNAEEADKWGWERKPLPEPPAAGEEPSDAIYTLLEARFESGKADVAARHDEHQP